MDMAQAKVTTDHDEIRKWAEARCGRPAIAREDGESHPAIITADAEPRSVRSDSLLHSSPPFGSFDRGRPRRKTE
jgi:hypothetical protein